MASIIKRKKSYSVVYNYTDENGETKQKWETWHTHKEALRRKAEVENQQNNGTFIPPNCQKVSEFLYDFVCTYGEKKWGVSMYDGQTALIANYINPIIGDMDIQEITPRVVDKYIQTLQKTPCVSTKTRKAKDTFVSDKTIEKIIKLLRCAFKQAVRWELIGRNPFDNTVLPRTEYAKRDIWDAETIRKALDNCHDGKLYVAMNLAFACSMRMGEILGLAGLIGAGRTELGKVIFGEAKKDSGTIRYKGKPVDFHSAGQALSSGIGYISENRKEEGVFLNFPVDWNITISALKKNSRYGFVNRKNLEVLADKMVSRFRVKTPSQLQLVRNLSGGNQQKIALAKVLALDTDIIIFDEPTRGIDVGVKQEIYHLMNELIENGVSIIMISSEMEELLGMSDRIVVLHEGRKMGEVMKKDFDQQKILTLASGIALEDKE